MILDQYPEVKKYIMSLRNHGKRTYALNLALYAANTLAKNYVSREKPTPGGLNPSLSFMGKQAVEVTLRELMPQAAHLF